MKSLIVFAALLVGMAACETPAPATGSETNTIDSTSTMSTTPMSTDTTSTTTDTSTMKKDSL